MDEAAHRARGRPIDVGIGERRAAKIKPSGNALEHGRSFFRR
jgi:hypothetical protein